MFCNEPIIIKSMFSKLKINKDNLYIYQDKKGVLRYESKIDNRKGIVHVLYEYNKNIYYIKIRGENFIIDL